MSDREISGWRKSRRSQEQGACVEVALMQEGVAVRDSKRPEGPVLKFDRTTFAALLRYVRE